MSIHNDIVLGLSVLALCFLVFWELRRKDRSWLLVRVIAVVLAVGCLAGMGWQVSKLSAAVSGGAVEKPVVETLAFDWPQRIEEGQRLWVSGKSVQQGKLVLTGLGAVLDSMMLKDSSFVLSTIPAHRGRAVYQLALVKDGDTLDRAEVPVVVDTPGRLRVLLLASSPGPESNFLIGWLASKGYGVASRIAIAKDRYVTSFSNMPERSLVSVTALLLSDFDIVITDSLLAVEQRAMEKGLGVILRGDSASGRSLPGLSAHGSGKELVLIQDSSYSWVLAGRREEYANYWSERLQQVARRSVVGEKWSWRPRRPTVGEPMELELQKGGDGVPQGLVGTAQGLQSAVYLAEDAVLPFIWRGIYWPVESGWHAVAVPGGDTSWLFVGEARRHRGVVSGSGGVVGKQLAGRGWLLTGFLLCLVFLWIERNKLLIIPS